jgi:virulence factor Mce-like protein
MRRATLITLLVVGIGAVAVVVGSSGGSSYRFAAVFDTAKGIVAGQQVKVAGAVVGTVDSVELAPGPKARIVMSIEGRFATFRQDASCSILPEGLISENYVQCDPGRASVPLTRSTGLPTVPLAHTSVPASLQDVLNVFSLPTDERLRVLISELGIATSGRGQDLNALLRRANPALVQSQRVLAIVDAQRRQLATAVAQTDGVLGQLARRQDQVRAFVDRASAVAQTTAQHQQALGEAVRRLPAMLAAVKPGLRSLDRAAANATPLLDELRASAPGLLTLTRILPSFSRAGLPALRTLGAAARAGTPAVRLATPIISRLLSASVLLRTLATGLDRLLVSSRGAGAIEGVLRVAYAFAVNTALYDSVSHILTFIVAFDPTCIAGQQAGFDVTGCSHKYTAAGQGQLPVNEPSCGPRDGSWYDARCPPPPPGPFSTAVLGGLGRPGATAKMGKLQKLVGRALTGAKPSTDQMRSLLTYLLK